MTQWMMVGLLPSVSLLRLFVSLSCLLLSVSSLSPRCLLTFRVSLRRCPPLGEAAGSAGAVRPPHRQPRF